jgi:ornithine carbamoyltransferase
MSLLSTKHLVSLRDVTAEDVDKIFAKADEYKMLLEKGEPHFHLQGRTLCLIWEKPSLRTRVSYTVAMHQLGGGVVTLQSYPDSSVADVHLKESDFDTVKTLSMYVDAIVARTFSHTKIENMAELSSKPVINGLSNYLHPVKILGDLYAVRIITDSDLKGFNFVYIGDGGWNTSQSLLLGCAKVGANLTMACPKKSKYRPADELWKAALADAERSGSKLKVVDDPVKAVEDADAIYAETWIPMGREDEKEERLADFQGYQVNRELMSHAKRDPLIMHPLPRTPMEMTDEVAYSPKAIMFDQASLKLHVEKALLYLLIN